MISFIQDYLVCTIVGLFLARLLLPAPTTPPEAVFLCAIVTGLLLLLAADLIVYELRRRRKGETL